MTVAHHNQRTLRYLTRTLGALSLTLALCAANPAFALDTGDIVVASMKGEVHIEVRGTDTKLRAGAVLELPATVRTGRDGAIELRQGATSISVGPETLLEFPALTTPGGSIDRIVQPRGTSFYNVGKRGGRKLRIETPFLVGVVKGTQFSVVAQDHATTISLFEGLLEIHSADDSDVIDLHAGEVAMRDRAATDISVLKMEAGATPPVQKAPATKPLAPNSVGQQPPRPTGNVVGDPIYAGRGNGNKPAAAPTDTTPARADTPVGTGGVNVDLGGAAVVDTTDNAVVVDTGSGRSDGPAASVEVNPGNGAATVDVGVSSNGNGVSVDVGAGDLGLGTEVDLGLAEEETDNSGPGNNSGNGNGNSGSGSDNSGPGNGSDNSGPGNSVNNIAPVVDTPDLGVEVAIGIPPAAIDVGAGDHGLGTEVDLGLAEEETDNSGPGNSGNSGSGNGNGNSGSGRDNSGPGNAVGNIAPVVDTPDLGVEVATGSPPAAIDAGANVSVGLGNTQVDLGADLGAVSDIDLDLEEEQTDNSGPGNSGNSNSGSGNGNSGSGSDNSGPGNAVDGLLDSLTRRSSKK